MALKLRRASFLSVKLYSSRGCICYSGDVLQGIIRSQRWVHSSFSNEDDDFSDLGPVVRQNGRTRPKLITEKPEFFAVKQKIAASRKISSGASFPVESIPTSNGLKISELFNGSHGKVKNYNGVPASKVSIEKVTVRICNICQETAYYDIHSICSAYGPLEGLVINADDSINAIFSMKDNSDVQALVNRLNKTTIDNVQWSAEVLLADSTIKTNCKNLDGQGDKCSLRDQIDSSFNDFKRKYSTKRICAEDLQVLHLALVDFESHPKAISG